MEKLANEPKLEDSTKICEFCKEQKSIVKVTFKKDGLFRYNERMNLCANCRDNLDDDIKIEEYEKPPGHYKW